MFAHILLVARREFRQITATRGFWVTLLILPLALAAGPLATRFLNNSETRRIMLIDSSGQVAPALRRSIDANRQRDLLNTLSRRAERYHLDRADPSALWAQHDRVYSDADVARFVAEGGATHALAAMNEAAAPDTPAFDPPEADYAIVPTPPAVAAAPPDQLDRALHPYLHPADGSDAKPLDYALYVPPSFGADPRVRLWTSDQPGQGFLTMLQGVLTTQLRRGYLAAHGVDPAVAGTANRIAPAIAVTSPPPNSGRERMVIRSILPLASAYILLMSLLLSGNWMLQGLVEERSNKLIENVLACISPNELMYGKLVGIVAVGLTMVVVWVGCGIASAYLGHGAIADLIRPALAPVSSPGIILTMIYFFVAGYVMMSMVFLSIGAMSDSIRDAQSYLTPVMMVIIIPFTILMQAVLQGSTGPAVTAMTWIPIFTPFTVLARLGTGMPVWQIVGSGLVLAAFVAIELVLLGRVFRTSLLSAGQKPNIARLMQLMRRDRQA